MKPTFMMSLKIYWSLMWRVYIASIIAGIGIVLVMLVIHFMMFGFDSLQDFMNQGDGHVMDSGFDIVMAVLGLAYIVLTFYIYRWAVNCLPEIDYKEGSVALMKHSMPVERFGLFDSICIGWSVAWRSFVLTIPYLAMSMIIAFFVGLGIPTEHAELAVAFLTIVNLVLVILIGILALHWMLARKKKGRWLSLEAQHESV